MKLKCVIFDFDGTLFDSMYLWDTGGGELCALAQAKQPKPTVREECARCSSWQAAEH